MLGVVWYEGEWRDGLGSCMHVCVVVLTFPLTLGLVVMLRPAAGDGTASGPGK